MGRISCLERTALQTGEQKKREHLHLQRPVLMSILRQGDSTNTKSRFVTEGHTWCAHTFGGVPDVWIWLEKCLRKTVMLPILLMNILQIFIALEHCLTFTSVQTTTNLHSSFFQFTGLFFIPVRACTIHVFLEQRAYICFCFSWPYLGFTLSVFPHRSAPIAL